jgi:hypothetical protein
MTDTEFAVLRSQLAHLMLKMPEGDTRALLAKVHHVLGAQQRDIEVLTVSLHDLAGEVDFGQ